MTRTEEIPFSWQSDHVNSNKLWCQGALHDLDLYRVIGWMYVYLGRVCLVDSRFSFVARNINYSSVQLVKCTVQDRMVTKVQSGWRCRPEGLKWMTKLGLSRGQGYFHVDFRAAAEMTLFVAQFINYNSDTISVVVGIMNWWWRLEWQILANIIIITINMVVCRVPMRELIWALRVALTVHCINIALLWPLKVPYSFAGPETKDILQWKCQAMNPDKRQKFNNYTERDRTLHTIVAVELWTKFYDRYWSKKKLLTIIMTSTLCGTMSTRRRTTFFGNGDRVNCRLFDKYRSRNDRRAFMFCAVEQWAGDPMRQAS